MQILEAHCVELGYAVNIYEAQRAYFAQPDGNRNRFHFLCSDEACRLLKTTVSGVNYHRLAEEEDKFRQMHFKAIHSSKHAETCKWKLAEEDVPSAPPLEDNFRVRTPRAKETNVIDEFSPRSNDSNPRPPAGQPTPSPKPLVEDKRDQDNEDAAHSYKREGHTKTSLLERFVDCWMQYEDDELREHYVTIEGLRLSYRQAVTQIRFVHPTENGKRIVYGGARVKLWPADKPSHIYINLIDECEKFELANGAKTLVIDLPLSRVSKHSSGALLLAKAKEAHTPEHYLQVFAWGTVEQHSRAGFQLKLQSLDNLVLKVRKSGAKRKDDGGQNEP